MCVYRFAFGVRAISTAIDLPLVPPAMHAKSGEKRCPRRRRPVHC